MEDAIPKQRRRRFVSSDVNEFVEVKTAEVNTANVRRLTAVYFGNAQVEVFTTSSSYFRSLFVSGIFFGWLWDLFGCPHRIQIDVDFAVALTRRRARPLGKISTTRFV